MSSDTDNKATEPMKLNPQVHQAVHRFEQAFHRNHRYCDCAMPMTLKKWNEALGTFAVLRLCCMARAVEQLTGIPLSEVFDFPPGWVWDCKGIHQSAAEDGMVEMVERGPPPAWLLKRMQEKGIEVLNLPEELKVNP